MASHFHWEVNRSDISRTILSVGIAQLSFVQAGVVSQKRATPIIENTNSGHLSSLEPWHLLCIKLDGHAMLNCI